MLLSLEVARLAEMRRTVSSSSFLNVWTTKSKLPEFFGLDQSIDYNQCQWIAKLAGLCWTPLTDEDRVGVPVHRPVRGSHSTARLAESVSITISSVKLELAGSRLGENRAFLCTLSPANQDATDSKTDHWTRLQSGAPTTPLSSG